jgi:hypothetical protein
VNDAQLRALVRAAIAQHLGSPAPVAAPPAIASLSLHPSHGTFAMLKDGAASDGPCIIEPAVMCNHCGYCKSFGH